ncbi:MAG TPA: BON domain-containing protein [Longimicrobiales bacterium]
MKTTEALQRRVVEELAWDPQVDSSDIAVTIEDACACLAGHVSSYSEKLAAEAAARRVVGVRSVVDKITVRVPTFYRDEDTIVANNAITSLQFDARLASERIKVVVEKGWIKLEGDVKWFFQKEAAEQAVAKLRGVKGITNNLTVAPGVPVSEVHGKIAAAFKREADIDAAQIKIETDGGRVILRGSVRSWSERRAAESAAYRAPGVTEVINELVVDVPVISM